MSCLYCLPTNLEHGGIALKVRGQLEALKERFPTTLIYVKFCQSDTMLKKYFAYLLFEIKCIIFSLFSKQLYIRYNPKSILLNIWITGLSFIKTIYVEHNTIYDHELCFLNRSVEFFIHYHTLRLFKWGRIKHIAVNNELATHLKQKQLSSVIYAQNAYKAPSLKKKHTRKIDTDTVSKVRKHLEQFTYKAIFCGNGYPWHGCQEIIQLVETEQDVGIIIIGPYHNISSPSAITIPSASTETVISLIEICDFAISTFRWDMLGISEGSPLKSRQYLCHGCPVLVNYYDCASDFDALKPFVISHQQSNTPSLSTIKKLQFNKEELKKTAQDCLSWEAYFNTCFESI